MLHFMQVPVLLPVNECLAMAAWRAAIEVTLPVAQSSDSSLELKKNCLVDFGCLLVRATVPVAMADLTSPIQIEQGWVIAITVPVCLFRLVQSAATICLFISPDLDGYRAPRRRYGMSHGMFVY